MSDEVVYDRKDTSVRIYRGNAMEMALRAKCEPEAGWVCLAFHIVPDIYRPGYFIAAVVNQKVVGSVLPLV